MPSKEDIAAGRTKDWEPKHPEFAGESKGVYDKPGEGGKPYEQSPATSHVFGWKLLAGGFLKFYAESIQAPEWTRAIVQVAFKPNPPKGSKVHPVEIKSEYVYAFPSVAEGEGWMAKFRSATNPGKVVKELEAAGIWYLQITKK